MTIEFVLWLPIIAGLVTLVVDVTTLYWAHSEMWLVARDTARRMSLGQLNSEADAERYATDALSEFGTPVTVEAIYDPSSAMEIVIGVSRGDKSIVGYGVHTIIGGAMVARVVMPSALASSAFGGGKGGGSTGGSTGVDIEGTGGNDNGGGNGNGGGKGNGGKNK